MRIAAAASTRDNNLNLIRVVAAMAVLISHSFALATGSPASEPLRSWLAITPGSIAVDVFFVASGFLVSNSLLRKNSWTEFILARCLRILPALFVALALTVFVLGPAMTTLSLASYFSSPETWNYLFKGSTLFGGVAFTLPGLFEGNALPRVVNGSLWTLPFEVKMYGLLLALWAALGLLRAGRTRFMRPALVTAAAVSGALTLGLHFISHQPHHFVHLFFMFFTGAAIWGLGERILLSTRIALGFSVALALSTLHRDAFFVVYTLTIAYLVMWVAFVPGGVVRRYNALGDYSYGLYIFAFPIQQTVVALNFGGSPGELTVIAAGLTAACAALSWHFVEAPCLALRERVSAAARSWRKVQEHATIKWI